MAAFHLPAQAGASVDQRLQDEPEGASGCLLACEQVLEELPPDRRGGPPGLVVRDDLAALPGLVLGADGTLARPGLALPSPPRRPARRAPERAVSGSISRSCSGTRPRMRWRLSARM